MCEYRESNVLLRFVTAMPDPWDSKTAGHLDRKSSVSSACLGTAPTAEVIGLFCDPYVANTNLEGGHSEPQQQTMTSLVTS